jgi:hypothetical protein
LTVWGSRRLLTLEGGWHMGVFRLSQRHGWRRTRSKWVPQVGALPLRDDEAHQAAGRDVPPLARIVDREQPQRHGWAAMLSAYARASAASGLDSRVGAPSAMGSADCMQPVL